MMSALMSTLLLGLEQQSRSNTASVFGKTCTGGVFNIAYGYVTVINILLFYMMTVNFKTLYLMPYHDVLGHTCKQFNVIAKFKVTTISDSPCPDLSRLSYSRNTLHS